MSWLSDIAGKAENLLNKIDKNAASVLKQTNGDNENGDLEHLLAMESVNETSHSYAIDDQKNPKPVESYTVNSPLRSTKKALILSANESERNKEQYQNGTLQIKSESNSNSRRSSFSSKSSKADGGTVIEKQVLQAHKLSNIKQQLQHQNYPVGKGALENELAAAKIVLNEVKSERDELKCEVDNLVEQLKNGSSQSILKELQDDYNKLLADRENLYNKNEMLDKSNSNYIKSISELEIKLSKHHQAEIDSSTKLEWAKREADEAINELQQYRSRAQTTLQMKEQLIEQLKTKNYPNENDESSTHTNSIELEHLKSENLNLTDERNNLERQLEETRNYVNKLEEMQRDQQIEFGKRLNSVNQNLKQDESKRIQYEDEYRAQAKELSMLRDEISKLQSDFSTTLRKKNSEIDELRTKLSQKSFLEFSNDLEDRLQSLTQSLVQKQNSLETVTADRNALRFQLEKIENQHRNTMLQLRQQRPQIINVNDTDDVKAQLPMFMQENPFDTGVARRVKRAYSSLDSLGVRFGVFLRRYPLIRILAIFYVTLLHFWVMLVLFSSRPT